jgi:antirestriction protein
VWLGCLECSSNGLLVGGWYAAESADLVTSSALHGQPITAGTHEEMWVGDHEGLPTRGESSPAEVARLARRIAELGEAQRAAFVAWIATGGFVVDRDGLPCVAEFEERFCGTWGSFGEYAEQLADDIGLLDDVPDHVSRYFDWDAWTRDLEFDYTVETAPDGGVFVFRVM